MRLKSMLLLAAMAIPATALAMGLGEIQLNSGLNEPFNARIDLVSVTAEELETLEVTLASEEAFERYDLPRGAELLGLQFEVVDAPDGAYVQITSREPMREPFVTLLVEADWANGRLLREYTVLLDPPVFDQAAQPAAAQPATTQPAPQPAPAPQPEPAVTTTESYTTGTVLETPAQPAAPAEVSPYPPVEPYAAPEGTYGRIRRGETLSEIALQLKPGDVSLNQMMIALYRANPEAFLGNINLIKQGAVLRIPDAADVRAISRSEANQRVKAQIAAWRGESGTTASGGSFAASGDDAAEDARLDLVAPGEATPTGQDDLGAGTGGDASGRFAELQDELAATREELASSEQSNTALQARIAELEAEIEEARSLLEIKDNRLLALQQQAQQTGAETGADVTVENDVTPEPGMPEAEQPAETAPAMDTVADETDTALPELPATLDESPATGEPAATGDEGTEDVLDATQPETTGQEPVAQPVTQEPVTQEEPVTQPAATGFPEPPQKEKTLVDTILGYLANPLILGALGVILLLVIMFVIMKMHAKPVKHKDTVSRWVAEEEDESHHDIAEDVAVADNNEPEAAQDAADENDMLETTMVSSTPLDQEQESESADTGTSTHTGHTTLVGGTAVNLDENDPLSEADFHMAYGLYDQAADGLQKALAADPSRTDLQLKLLEVHFTAGNKDEFVTAARNFQDSGASGADWQNVLIMGKQIAPDETMFSEGTSAGTDTNVDLDIGGGDDTETIGTDFDLGEESETSSEAASKDSSDDMLEFDLGDMGSADEEAASDTAGTQSSAGIDSKVGTDSQAEFDKALDELSNTDVGTASIVGDNEPSETAEVDTKLDLARAYVDMGDPDGARSILEEVMEDGSDNQKQQAQELLDQLG